MSIVSSYELAARYYDAVYRDAPQISRDAAFYETLAVDSGGPVLELGCGTGRVLLAIAARGLACSGVDQSPAMLEECRRKPGADALALTCAPMERFDLGGRRFAFIFSAFRAFQHLDTVEQQLACLANVRRHLAPGGTFAFDVFNPSPARMGVEREPEVVDTAFEFEGRSVKRYASVTRDVARQIMHVSFRFEDPQRPAGTPDVAVKLTMRWFWRYELEHLMHRAGFADVTIYSDFDRSPIEASSPALIVVARVGI